MTCLNCDAKRIHSRGCCGPCYKKQQKRVVAGEISDTELVETGQRAPTKKHHNHHTIKHLFAGNK